MVVAVHPVRTGGTRPSVVSPPAVPYGILIGASVITERGVDHAREAPAASVRVLGRRSGEPAAWCRLSGGPDPAPSPWEQMIAVLRYFGQADALR
jgi:hypothetical protein